MIDINDSHNIRKLQGQNSINASIGKLDDDVEIIFLHCCSNDGTKEKWTRRCQRICWDNLIIKFSEQNYATPEHLHRVDNLPYGKNLFL